MYPILQTESSECGIACLAMISSHYGHHNDLAELRRRFSISQKGANLVQLLKYASALHLNVRPLRLELNEMSNLTLPSVLHWNLNHFVVLERIERDLRGRISFILLDPAIGRRRITAEEASHQFTGVALEFSPNPDFEAKDERQKLNLGDLTGPIIGLRSAIAKLIALALALEIFAVTAPLFNQFIVDNAIVSGDKELLLILTFAFAILLFTQTAIGMGRNWFLMRLNMDVSIQWSTRVLAHLVRLPVSYFEKRHLGDVVSRFGSINAIQGTLTNIFLESALDGMMVFMSFGMMILYSKKLAMIVLIAVLIYGILRWAFYSPFREASQERLILSAKESSHFLETIRAITSLKLFGRENERLATWQNLKIDVQNRDIKTQKISLLFSVSNTLIFGVQGLLVFYVGATLVIENALTVGMLMAFSSYASTFTGRLTNLIDLFSSYKMLSMHGDRLADIVLERKELDLRPETDISRLQPNITLKNIKFRYADGEPWVLNDISLEILAGESVALVGPSGCGKTTLCKIILGLLKPTEGEVLVNGIPVNQLGLNAYRQLIGTVMQDDTLLAGSIGDNITFFDRYRNQAQMEESAKTAAIHEDIIKMPMGYQTLVGDMGSSLSGGQKQRVLLARALYKKPMILALDEATSHLDLENEKKVNKALAQLTLTRIMIAHRPDTITSAQTIVTLSEGKILGIAKS